METQFNPQLKLAFDFLQYTNQNIFLTGKAGTGKTTFLKSIRKISPKRMIVVAPTGVAAINAGGVTIHSFFQLSFGPQIPVEAKNLSSGSQLTLNDSDKIKRFSKNKINIIKSLDLLIIDEISMVRADILDAIDSVLRRFKNRYKPFGGIQVLMIGDLQQLAPVVKKEEWDILGNYYETCYFFSSHALKKSEFIGIELTHIYRQNEQDFIDLLNKVRDNKLDVTDLQLINSRHRPAFSPGDNEGYITLTTHNYQAREINNERLQKLTTRIHKFKCSVEGDFPKYYYPADEVLELKVGAQVMFVKNDISPGKRFYNGKIGKITRIEDKNIEVQCPGETEPIPVEPAIWENTKYKLNETTSEIEENVAGIFKQYPLKLAWAITIHKSQGLTFEKAIIDARQSFAHGQVYVALSRCTNLDGLILKTRLNTQSVINDSTVIRFTNEVEENQPDKSDLDNYRKLYELELLNELFDFNPLIRPAAYILKIWSDNRNTLMGNLQDILIAIMRNMEHLAGVAAKFRLQIDNLSSKEINTESNTALQERLKKAGSYFFVQTEQLIENPLKTASFESDNRSIYKKIADALARLENELNIKKACLKLVSDGFNLKKYLETRALAAIEKPSSKKMSSFIAVNVEHPELYTELLKWREHMQIETGLAESKILRHKVMAEIANQLPATAARLKKIKGMGGKKMELFGREILGLIMEYRQKKGMDIPLNASEEITFAGLGTKEISLEYFRHGLDAEKIAKKRSMAVSTIESHLSHFIGTGKLDIFQVIDRDKYNIIAQHLNKKPAPASLSEIKNQLGDNFSYGELRMVIADLKQGSGGEKNSTPA